MQLDLKKLFDGEDQVLPFAQIMDLSEAEQWGEKPFHTPVAIAGQVQNRAGIVTISYRAEYTLCSRCARCLEPIEEKRRQEFSHTVVRKLNQQEDDDYIVVEDGILDLDALAQDDILLELPIKMLCSEDCKGLCPICGCNLNQKQCGCTPEKWDGRRVKAFDDL